MYKTTENLYKKYIQSPSLFNKKFNMKQQTECLLHDHQTKKKKKKKKKNNNKCYSAKFPVDRYQTVSINC